MERPTPRAMASRWRILALVLAAAAAGGGVLPVHGQVDNLGFISIDCGLPEKAAGYVDNATKLSFSGDAPFTDAGTNHNISAEHLTPGLSRSLQSARSFPGAARSCYTLRSLVAGLKYLVRAIFMYGNYDGLNRPPVFDLHVGVNFWQTVNVSDSGTPVLAEIIVVVPGDSLQVCLVNTGSGTPFISGLSLRPFKNSLYPQANATQGLVLVARFNFGPSDNTIVRYPDDPHDRIWLPWSNPSEWSEISTTNKVQNVDDDNFEVPTAVMQTAVTPINASSPIQFWWDAEPTPNDPSPGYYCNLHFSELERLPSNAVRQFYITLNDKLWYPYGFTPQYLFSDAIYSTNANHGYHRYNVSLNATTNSTLPPILNAAELYSVIGTNNVETNAQDVSAMTTIKANYQVRKNWMGDPCVPKKFVWDGLSCSYAISNPPSVKSLNLSSSGLSGNISSSFGSLKGLQYLDLSHNDLTGTIPDSLSQLPSLTFLDLTGNQLTGAIPSGLLKRAQDGSLNLRYGNNTNLCTNGNSCQPPKGKSKPLAVYIAVPVVLITVIVLVAVLLFCFLRRKRQGSMDSSVKHYSETTTSYAVTSNSYEDSTLQLKNRRFTYKELETLTNNLERVLGRGGFGSVYHGVLEDGTQVAVKLRSQTSNQGVKQFLGEAEILTRIHHKNLVSMIGYCKDGEHMALVYEYMSEGTLQEHITGSGQNTKYLTWRQRLRAALESAQGLEYLHRGCNPPLIHRDVKTTNILLNARLEAKIADFGLSKPFNLDNGSHVSTNTVVGTIGYLDPEYHATMQLTTKSDVYSFGVVLLELVSGRPAIVRDPEPTGVIQWARQRLARGNIEGVVDARMRGDHDVNGVWKAADVALKCTAQASAQRPTMAEVVAQLQECLDLEERRGGAGDVNSMFYTGGGGEPNSSYSAYATDPSISTDVSQGSTAFEMEHNFGRVPTMATTGPAAR